MHAFPITALIAVLAASNFLVTPAEARHCPRCEKIEQERAQEQAEQGPQPIRYYDDQIGLTTPQDRSTSNDSQESLNKTQPGSTGNLNKETSSTNFSSSESLLHEYGSQENEIPNPDRLTENQNSNPEEAIPLERRVYIQSLPHTPTYSTLLVLLQSKDFIQTLNGPFTLFIPSNDALRRLPPGTLQDLLRPENQAKLSDLIANHFVATKISTKDLTPSKVKTIGGKELDIRPDRAGVLTINGAHVLKSENAGPNGIIYVIDQVL